MVLRPAVIVDDDIVVEGADVIEGELENIIQKHLGMTSLEPEKKGVLGCLFGR